MILSKPFLNALGINPNIAKVFATSFFIFGVVHTGMGQIFQQGAFDFLNLSPTSRISSQGGVNITSRETDTLYNNDGNMIPANPAMAYFSGNGNFGMSYQPYFAGIWFVNLGYTSRMGKNDMWGANLQYFNYGAINGYDPAGNRTGKYVSNAYAFTINHAKKSGNFTFGINGKVVSSQIVGYKSWGLATDLGVVFAHPNKDLTVSVVLKNLGIVVQDFIEDGRTGLPSDLQVGLTFKPEYMPFRFSFTGYKLLPDNFRYYRYDNLNISNGNNKVTTTIDNIIRHITFGGEILLSEHIHIMMGYNHLVASALKIQNAGSTAGFSGGLLFRQQNYSVGLSRSYYHVTGGISQLTANANLSEIIR